MFVVSGNHIANISVVIDFGVSNSESFGVCFPEASLVFVNTSAAKVGNRNSVKTFK